MKRFLLALMLIANGMVWAQPNKNQAQVDSLIARIGTLKASPERVDEMVLTGLLLRKFDMENARAYADKALAEAQQLDYLKGEGNAYNLLGILKYYTSELDSAEHYQLKAIAIRLEANDTLGLAKAYIDLGNIAADRGNLNKAIEQYLTAQPYIVAAKDTQQLANLYANIGSIFHEQKDYEKTLEYNFKALDYKEHMAPNGLAVVYNNIALVYKHQERYEEALSYSFKSLELKESLQYLRGIAGSYNTIGSIYLKTNQLDSASAYYHRAIELYRSINDKYGLGMALGGKGDVLFKQGKHGDAKKMYLDALPLAEAEGLLTLQRDVNLALAEVYEADGDYNQALDARKKYEAAKDSVVNEETNDRIAELMTQFETVQKEQELKLKQIELERQQEINKFQTIGFGVVVLFLLLAGGLYFSRNRIKQKAELADAIAREQKIRFKAVIDAQEQERKRVAQDLHDGLGQLLSTARLNVSALEDSLDPTDTESDKIWLNALSLIDESVQEVRNVSHNMMPSALIRLGLVAALREQVAKINRAGKITVKLEIAGMETRMDEAVEITLYRVVQEVLNNAIKHSNANEIVVSINRGHGKLELGIKDDGVGLDLQLIKRSTGIGWQNIYSRVELINGVIGMNSSPGAGTNVHVLVPAA
jgi:two-component system, NarL family, sensor kinase